MTQSTVGATGFQPTPRAVERFENRVSELLDVLTDGWIEQGADPGSEDIQKARDAIAESMRVPEPVSYTHLTLPTIHVECRSRWSPYH